MAKFFMNAEPAPSMKLGLLLVWIIGFFWGMDQCFFSMILGIALFLGEKGLVCLAVLSISLSWSVFCICYSYLIIQLLN